MKNYKDILAENRTFAENTFEKINKKALEMAKRSRYKLVDGVEANGLHHEVDPTWWTSGFFGGMNYMLYAYTKNEEYLKTGKAQEKLMDAAFLQDKNLHHDVGFQWHILSGASYALTGDEDSRRRAFYAACTLFSRYVIDGKYIIAWPGKNEKNWTIIDSMMNIPLLYRTSELLDDDRFARVAKAHADTLIRTHLREDGSVAHIVEHDRETGDVICTYAGQGCAVGSSWSRGQAWGLYGFILSYIHTKEQRYLDAARRIADYFLSCVEKDGYLPRVDFRSPDDEPVYYDSTAGACAACGLIEIAKALPENEGGFYLDGAIKMLRAMEEKFTNYDVENDHILDYGTVRYPIKGVYTPEQAKVHISIIYGDFFFTEAILKLLEAPFLPW